MKLHNHTTIYLAGIVFLIITLWALIFYYAMLDEIYDSIDDGLDNRKGLIIQKAAGDSSILNKNSFGETDYSLVPISASDAVHLKDTYIDTSMYMQNEDDFEPVRLLRTFFMQGGKYYKLEIATSMVEEDDLVKELLYALIWLYLGLLLSFLLLNSFLLKRIWGPFYRLMKSLKGFRLEKPVPIETKPTSIDEFRLLNETVHRLIKTNIETYTNQKQFIENASHELQTPLAISINKLEALAEEKDLNDEQLGLLSSALDNLERLTRLNKSLLLLSKIENRQFADDETVDINRLINTVIADFSDQLVFSNISSKVSGQGQLVINMNADLALILVSNLIKNAIVHNKRGGFIHIHIGSDSLSIKNSGVGTSLDGEKIFNRFHTDPPSPGSTGLGLAIVKAIAVLYSLSVKYSFDGEHVITMSFPKKQK